MCSEGLLTTYNKRLEEGKIRPDPRQQEIALALEALNDDLKKLLRPSGGIANFLKLIREDK